MDWSRTGSYLHLALWGLLLLSLWSGGWLLCARVFKLRSRERLIAGLATGLLLFILFANLLAQLFTLSLAYWGAALLVLGLGLASVWRSPTPLSALLQDLHACPALLALAGLFGLFLGINRGLALFDDYSNIPLVSIIATGDVPPHFYLNPQRVLDYHYGLHLLAASLTRLGGFYPWTALDVCKALAISLAVGLGVLWYRRFAPRGAALVGGGLFILFAGGARWLLLLIPPRLLERMSVGVELIGSASQSASDFSAALTGAWRIEGDGPLPFPFAFISGVSRPLTLAMGSNGALPTMTLFLLLLLARRRWRPAQGLLYGLILASLALTSEHLFALVFAGTILAAAARGVQLRSWRAVQSWGWVWLPGAILAPVMGGVLSQLVQRAAAQFGGAPVEGGLGLPGIALRWPPAVFSAHFGALALSQPGQLFIALIELGPLLLLSPLVAMAGLRYLRSGKLIMAGLSGMALASFCAPLFLRFVERERDITRLTGSALTIWAVLGLPYLWLAFRRGREWVRWAIGLGYLAAIMGGIGLFPAQLTAILKPQPSYYIQEADLWMSRDYWDQLEPGVWVLDPAFPYRPAALFGRTTGPAYQSVYIIEPAFQALLDHLTPDSAARSGYRYLYIERGYWSKMTPEQRRLYQQDCVHLISERKTNRGDFRRLYDIHDCRNAP